MKLIRTSAILRFLWLSLCLVFVTSTGCFGQSDEDAEMNIAGPGVDFSISGGAYFGSKVTAAYYSGIPSNENNLNYIFNNYSWKQNIIDLISRNNSVISASDSIYLTNDSYPREMKYSTAMSVSIGTSYRFDRHWRINLYYTFARLTAKGMFAVYYDSYTPGNEVNDYFLYGLLGKENRSMFDLTGSYTFHASKFVKPYVEFGAQFNFVRVKSFDAVIEEKEFNLLDIYGGATYVQGAYMQTYDPHYGGAGWGVVASAGIKFAFSPSISIDPCFYVSFGKINLTGYKDYHFNYGAYVRLVMSDAMFRR